jgi:recombination protein RecT
MAEAKTNLEKNISVSVGQRVEALVQAQALVLPKDYVPENALKAAWLMLPSIVDKDKNKVLDVCTPESISNALFDMCVRGLNPFKSQGYFIAFGKELKWLTSGFGNEVVAKRVGGLKWIKGTVIYAKDEFEYEIDSTTARVKVIRHKQVLENIDITTIRGGYATYELEDGTMDVVPMTIAQIEESWKMGSLKGKGDAHLKFTDQMVIKTVKNRACKFLINGSSDAALLEDKDPDSNIELAVAHNAINIEFTDVSDPKNPIVNPAPDAQQPAAQQPQQKQAKPEAPVVEAKPEAKPATEAKLAF